MLKKVMFIAAIAVSSLSYGQLEVKDVTSETVKEWNRGFGEVLAKVEKYSDNSFSFLYWDNQYKHINEWKSFSFYSLDSYNQFGDLIKKQMKAKKGSQVSVNFDDTSILITTRKMLRVGYVDLVIDSPKEAIGYMMIDSQGAKKLF